LRFQEGHTLVGIIVVIVGTAICLQAAVFALAAGHDPSHAMTNGFTGELRQV
jgi:hypothetical protein